MCAFGHNAANVRAQASGRRAGEETVAVAAATAARHQPQKAKRALGKLPTIAQKRISIVFCHGGKGWRVRAAKGVSVLCKRRVFIDVQSSMMMMMEKRAALFFSLRAVQVF